MVMKAIENWNLDDDDACAIGLLADRPGDILIKTNRAGFIDYASEDLSRFGIEPSSMLFPPHLGDIAQGDYSAQIMRYHARVIGGAAPPSQWLEFPAFCDSDPWYALSLRRARGGAGALGVVRMVGETEPIKARLASSEFTDRLTQLPNRRAFLHALANSLMHARSSALIIIEIDHFRAITMRFGYKTGDKLLAAFASFLRSATREGTQIARLEGERFAIILDFCELVSALAFAQDLVTTFADISAELDLADTRFTASAGVARIEANLEQVMRRAEMGVIVAKASGGMRTECGDWLRGSRQADSASSLRVLAP